MRPHGELPTVSGSSTSSKRSGQSRFLLYAPVYVRRLVKMDLELCFWQMINLCINPSVVYRHATYHKQTKNQWARDDPAFVVFSSLLVAIAAAAYCVAFGDGLGGSVLTILSAVVVDYLLLGVVLATIGWLVSNRYLRAAGTHSHAVEQRVEWMYAFDVHCNSYFPLFLQLYVVQYLLCPLLLRRGFLAVLLSNALYGVALSYYHYTQFLGYSALPFLDRTEFFLYPIAGIAIALPLSIMSGFNPTRFVLGIYFGV